MNLILTSAWFAGLTYLGYTLAPEGKEIGFAVASFGVALVLRLIVWAMSGASYSGGSYSSSSGSSDSGFFSFFDGGSSDGGSCSGGGGCSGGCGGGD